MINVVTPDLMDAVITGARELPHGESELELSGEPTLPSARVKPPRLARTPASLECALLKIVEEPPPPPVLASTPSPPPSLAVPVGLGAAAGAVGYVAAGAQGGFWGALGGLVVGLLARRS